VLAYVPVTGSAGTVTLTLRLQVLLGAMVPFENASTLAPALGAKVALPQPDVAAFGEAAPSILPGVTGRVAVKLMPVSVDAVGFDSKKLRVVDPPATLEL